MNTNPIETPHSAHTRVTRVEIDHDGDRLETTISVTRVYPPYSLPGSPDAADVPQDVRDALRAWLDGAR